MIDFGTVTKDIQDFLTIVESGDELATILDASTMFLDAGDHFLSELRSLIEECSAQAKECDDHEELADILAVHVGQFTTLCIQSMALFKKKAKEFEDAVDEGLDGTLAERRSKGPETKDPAECP